MSMNAATEASAIQQVSHRSSMDRMYRLQRHIYDATRAYYLLGRDQMLKELSPSAGHLVLEVGCGTGRNLAKAATLYPECHFFGVDISDEMLKTAAMKIAAAGLEKKVSLFQGDATALSVHPAISRLRFDRIYFSYTLSMIPEWQLAIATATSLLSESGRLHIVDFGPCNGLPPICNTVLRKWLSAFGVAPRDTMAQAISSSGVDQTFFPTYKLSHRGYAAHASLSHRHKTVTQAS